MNLLCEGTPDRLPIRLSDDLAMREVQTYVGWGAYSLREVDGAGVGKYTSRMIMLAKDASEDYRKQFNPRTFENLNQGGLKLVHEKFIVWGLSMMESIRSSFTPKRMRAERGKCLINAWQDVNNDSKVNDLFAVAWESIWSDDNDDEDGEKETVLEKVRLRLTRIIFNARCNTTFNWYKRNALNNDRVNFRGTLRVKSMKELSKDISSVFDDLENDVMSGDQTTPIQRELVYDEESTEAADEPKKKKQKKTVKGLIASRLPAV